MGRSSWTVAVTTWLAVAMLGSARLPADHLNFQRGDTNIDGIVEISDGIASLKHLFTQSFQAGCLDAADANDDGGVNVSAASGRRGPGDKNLSRLAARERKLRSLPKSALEESQGTPPS